MPKAESPGAIRPAEMARIVNATRVRKKKLPPLRPNSVRKPPDGRYREQYGLIVLCPSAAVQQSLYDALRTLTHCKLRVVTT
jgi:hypothetical protein